MYCRCFDERSEFIRVTVTPDSRFVQTSMSVFFAAVAARHPLLRQRAFGCVDNGFSWLKPTIRQLHRLQVVGEGPKGTRPSHWPKQPTYAWFPLKSHITSLISYISPDPFHLLVLIAHIVASIQICRLLSRLLYNQPSVPMNIVYLSMWSLYIMT